MTDSGFPLPSVHHAGTHLIVELWGVSPKLLTDETLVEQLLSDSARDAGATVLHTHFHHFGEGYGITGVVVLQESHISIHTWPEMEYAALDLFMCGVCNPNDSLPRILKAFDPKKVGTTEMLRGIVHTERRRTCTSKLLTQKAYKLVMT